MYDNEWAGLAGQIRFRGGFEKYDVEELVRLIGHQKPGARVIERIEQKLAENNIGHLPTKLPTEGARRVLLYSKDQAGLGFVLHLVHRLATEDPADGNSATVNQLETLLGAIRDLTKAVGSSN